jgi:hypothetical protein
VITSGGNRKPANAEGATGTHQPSMTTAATTQGRNSAGVPVAAGAPSRQLSVGDQPEPVIQLDHGAVGQVDDQFLGSTHGSVRLRASLF